MDKGRLLIVEDEKIIAFDLHNRLVSFGYRVLGEFSRGTDAIEAVRQLQPDLVLMDIFIKGEIDGIQAALVLRNELNTPVIFITAHSDELTLQRAKIAEPFGYILKPFDDRDLRTVIEMGIYKAEAEKRLRESEARYRGIVEDQTDLIVRYLPDFTLTFVNDAFCRFFDKPREFFLGKNYLEWASPQLVEESQLLLRQYTFERPVQMFDARLNMPDGKVRWVQWRTRGIYTSKHSLSEIQAVGRDITTAKQLEDSLRESNERYLLAAEGANDGVWDWDLRTGRIFFSTRFKETLGYSGDEIGETLDEWFALVHPDDLPAVRQAFSDHLAAKTPLLHQECRLQRSDGTYGWFSIRGLAVCKPEHPPHRAAGSLTDITRQKEYQEQLSFKAFHDSLTGLANRSLFLNRLQHALDRYRPPRKGLAAVLFLDLDFFKLVNDSLGHQAGDALLVGIAQRLEESLRPSDTLARFGGDEFAVLVEDINSIEDGVMIAQRIQQQLSAPFFINGKNLYISVSIGVTDTSAPGADSDSILHDVDIAMYLAKEKGRGRYEVFNRTAAQRQQTLGARDKDLDRAIQQNELSIDYQPIYSHTLQRVIALEAVPHWNRPGMGQLKPKEFIETIVDSSLLDKVTGWLLETACQQAATIQQEGFPELNVVLGFTLPQFSLSNLPGRIEAALASSGLGAEHLEIEIGEEIAAGYLGMLGHIFEKITGLGVRVNLSGYGSRYRFLGELEQAKILSLKLETNGWGGGGPGDVRTRALVELGRSHNLQITANGIETHEQYRFFRSLECDTFQGNFISPPLSGATLLEYLKNPVLPFPETPRVSH